MSTLSSVTERKLRLIWNIYLNFFARSIHSRVNRKDITIENPLKKIYTEIEKVKKKKNTKKSHGSENKKKKKNK